MNNINLRNMEKGQSGVITAVKVAGHLGQRIREKGLVPGTKIKIQGRAPQQINPDRPSRDLFPYGLH